MKIKVLSPVHVGTGEAIPCYCYDYSETKGVANCYDAIDVLSTIPANILLDNNNLRRLSYRKATQEEKHGFVLDNAVYSKLKPKYKVSIFEDLDYSDTSEQVKSLMVPFIPGSTIKGAIMHAVIYRLIKENYQISGIKENIEAFSTNGFSTERLFSIYFEDRQFYKDFARFLICEDIFFDRVGLYSRKRYNSQAPVNNCEAILPGQSSETVLFTIQYDRMKQYMINRQPLNKKEQDFIERFTVQYVLDSIRIETADNLKLEEEYNFNIAEIRAQIKDLQEINRNSYVVRVGDSTNYWEKSISYLIKENDLQFYLDNFEYKFAPIKNKLDPETMPKTRMLITENNKKYLAGYLEIIQ